MENEEFYKRLRRLREERGLTMKAFAQKIDVPVSTYREWEYGRTILGTPYPKMATALDVGLLELLTGQKPNKHEIFENIHLIEELTKKVRTQLESFL